ncbi:MAG: STAS domain-containing protein [Blastocatellia bacterium]
MEISERKVGKITIIKIQGQAIIDQKTERLSQLVRERLQAGERLFVINLADCSRMDSTGLGELVKSHKLITDCEGVMKLAEVALHLRGLFVVTNLTEIMEIFDKEQQAINSFGA